jgi:hypothetical protein
MKVQIFVLAFLAGAGVAGLARLLLKPRKRKAKLN